MARTASAHLRCPRCHLHLERCHCAELPRLDLATRVCLVVHAAEVHRPSATGPLALECLPNHERHVHGLRDVRVDLGPLHDTGRRVLLLYPGDDARPLDAVIADGDPRPVTLVVPEGSWGQAQRMARRLPGVDRAEKVVLPAGGQTEWGLREETKAGGLATFEAIARALGLLEGAAVHDALMTVFRRHVAESWAMRGVVERTPTAPAAGEPAPPLEVLYEDDVLVVIRKPAGALVHRGWGDDEAPVLQRLRDQLGRRVHPAHRLDRATSGALAFAKTSAAAAHLQEQFATQAVHKRYLALCRGHDAGLTRVDHALAAEPGADKKPAVTELRLLGQSGRYGLYEARPLTGRLHQIRRHLKHASHPIIGDVRYGKGEHNRVFRDTYGFHRLALHCAELRFTHPVTGAEVVVTCPPDAELAALFAALGLHDALGAAPRPA